MKEKNEIDELFKNGLNKEYPFDENLWSSVESQLNNPIRPRLIWNFNLNSMALFLVLMSCALIPTDSVKTSSQTKSQISANRLAKLAITQNESSTANKSKHTKTEATQQEQIGSAENLILHHKNSTNNKSPKEINSVTSAKKTKTNGVNQPKILAKNSNRNLTNSPLKVQPDHTGDENINLVSRAYSDFKMKLLGFNTLTTELYKNPKMNGDGLDLNKMQRKLKPNFYYFEIEASRSTKLSKKTSGGSQNFLNYKNKNEKALFRQSIGVNVMTNYKNFSLGLGIHFTKFIEKATYPVDGEIIGYETIYDTNYRIVNGNFNSNGHPVLLIKEEINSSQIEKTVKTRNQLVVQNKFKRIQLPVALGYQKGFGNWMAAIQTAFVFNYLVESNGLYVNKDLNTFESFNQGKQFNQLMYSQKNQVSVGYLLNEFVLVGGRFSYEYDLNSYTKDYDSKFQSYNLGLWLQWKLQ